MKIDVKSLTGTTYSFNNIQPTHTLTEVKKIISERINMRVESLQLLINNKVLPNDKTMEELGVIDGMTLQLIKSRK
jgi:hypothetical protein